MELFPPFCNGCLQKYVGTSRFRKMIWFLYNKADKVSINWIAGSNITTSNKNNWKYKRYAIRIHYFNGGRNVDTIKILKRVDIVLNFRDCIHISHDIVGINDTMYRVRYVVAMDASQCAYFLSSSANNK